MYQYKPHQFTLLAVFALLCAGIVSSVGVRAEPEGPPERGFNRPPHDFGPRQVFRVLHDLDVSPEQRTAIDAVLSKHRPLMREFMTSMMAGKKALNGILTGENFDAAQIDTLAAAQAANAEKMFRATAKSFAEISAILTAEQRQTLAKKLAAMGRTFERKIPEKSSDGDAPP